MNYVKDQWKLGEKHKWDTIQNKGLDICVMNATIKGWEKNAQLISATLELLEASERAVARLNQLTQPNSMEQAIITELQQAIQKAEVKQ